MTPRRNIFLWKLSYNNWCQISDKINRCYSQHLTNMTINKINWRSKIIKRRKLKFFILFYFGLGLSFNYQKKVFTWIWLKPGPIGRSFKRARRTGPVNRAGQFRNISSICRFWRKKNHGKIILGEYFTVQGWKKKQVSKK